MSRSTRDARMPRVAISVLAAVAWWAGISAAQESTPPTPNPDAETEVLLRGPMHEAFAQPMDGQVEAGITVAKEPPDPIQEVPPEIKPSGQAIWIPGYWAWDFQREDFLWVSGVWRVPPGGRRWVPGYWNSVNDGYQWISGFWAPVEAETIDYLPNPPETQEAGPNSPSPSANHMWVPGSWMYRNDQYVWRPGYWATGYDGWVWVPHRFVWTPRGSIFVNGYWDYPLAARGMYFAPVYFRSPIYARAGYRYVPTNLIDLAAISLQLFVRPTYGHYYFGDWYGGGYGGAGIYAPYAYNQRFGYDPLYSYYRWNYARRGIDYDDRMRNWYRYLDQNEGRRPPRTWNDRQDFVARNNDWRYANSLMAARTVQDVVGARRGGVERIEARQRQQLEEVASSLNQIREARKNASRTPASPDRAGRGDARPRLNLPQTTELERMVEQRGARGREATGGREGDGTRGRPDTGGGNPAQDRGRPDAGGGNPARDRGRPDAGGGNPARGRGRPDAGGGNPARDRGRPDAGGGNPARDRGRPDAGGGNPARGRGRPDAGRSGVQQPGVGGRVDDRPPPRRIRPQGGVELPDVPSNPGGRGNSGKRDE